jgi:hypothetical protein
MSQLIYTPLPTPRTPNPLVDIKGPDLIIRLAQLLVLAHKHNLRNPRERKRRNRERSTRTQRNDVARLVGLGPEVRRPVGIVLASILFVSNPQCVGYQDLPDERSVHDRCDNSNRNRLLLRCLSTRRSAPSEDKRVDTVCADGEDDHGCIATRNANGRAGDEEPDGGDALGYGDVPCAFVELARGPGDGDCDDAGDEVGWAGQDKGDELGEAEGFDDCGKEVLEAWHILALLLKFQASLYFVVKILVLEQSSS